jgi:hypothetical protein
MRRMLCTILINNDTAGDAFVDEIDLVTNFTNLVQYHFALKKFELAKRQQGDHFLFRNINHLLDGDLNLFHEQLFCDDAQVSHLFEIRSHQPRIPWQNHFRLFNLRGPHFCPFKTVKTITIQPSGFGSEKNKGDGFGFFEERKLPV